MVTSCPPPPPSRPVKVILHSASRLWPRHKRCRAGTAADSPSESESGRASKVRRCLRERVSGRSEECKVCCLLMKRDSPREVMRSKSSFFPPLWSANKQTVSVPTFVLSAACFNLSAWKAWKKSLFCSFRSLSKPQVLSERMQNILSANSAQQYLKEPRLVFLGGEGGHSLKLSAGKNACLTV